MDQLLQGVKFTVCRLDDILISGSSPEEHLALLKEVFRRLQEHGIRLNPAKCIFLQSGLEFFGHWIDKNGIRPLPQKKSLRRACDVSPYGVGAVISHVMEKGEEKPIAFASRTLIASERNYS